MSSPRKVPAYVVRIVEIAIVVAAIFVMLRLTVLRPAAVQVATIARADVLAEVEGTGTVTVDVLASVGPKINGRVEKVLVDEGDTVQAGQIVALLDDTDLKRKVDQARAQLASARVTAWEQQREWNREKELVSSGAVSIEESEQYLKNSSVAQAEIKAAQAETRLREYELTLTKIPSLITGVVTKRWVVPGNSVVVGQPMFTVADTGLTYVSANIDQDFTSDIRVGEPAMVILRGSEADPIKGRVFRIDPEADQATEEMIAEVTFPISPSRFQLGQWAQVYIQVGEAKDALAVPKTAIVTLANQRFVFVAGVDSRVRRVLVKELAASPRSPMVAVTGNLRAGEHVVMMPMGLKEGERVSLATPAGKMQGMSQMQ